MDLPKHRSSARDYMHEKLIHLRTRTLIEFAKLATFIVIAWILVEKL